jgi:hypothetical protein
VRRLKTWINEWWVVGGIYSPNHQRSRWWRLLSHGAPDSPVRHRTLSGAPQDTVRCTSHITRPLGSDRWSFWQLGHRTVRWCTGQSDGAPDSHCSLSGAPSAPVLTSVRAGAHCSTFIVLADDRWRCVAVTQLAHRTVRCYTGQSGATPDSPVNYSGVAPRIPEGGKFRLEFPGAPDTVRWHTGQSGAPDQGTLRLSFALFIWTLSWSFYWFVVNL